MLSKKGFTLTAKRQFGFTLITVFSSKNTDMRVKHKNGFTLIELLVVIAIIGILIGISLVALQGARAAGRDARRKGDLEQIRSALEVYRSDCALYPNTGTIPFGTGALTGSCPTASTYVGRVPQDPQSPSRIYHYRRVTNTTYELCARLENGGTAGSCPGSNCGGGQPCNYIVTNP